MPQLNTHRLPKNEPGASGKSDSGINNVIIVFILWCNF